MGVASSMLREKSKVFWNIPMIFATVGHKEFERLTKTIDGIANNSDEEFILQIGYRAKYLPQNASYFDFVSRSEIDNYFERASLLISHCTVSSILYAKMYGKPLITIPRLSCFGEAIDDHQVDFAREMQKGGVVDGLFIIHDINELEQTIKEARDTKVTYAPSGGRKALIEGIRQFINDI